MVRRTTLLAGILALLAVVAGGVFASGWWGSADIDEDTEFVISSGSSLTAVAGKLESDGLIASADAFLLRAKIFGSSDPIKTGEFLLPAGASSAAILDTFQHGDVIRRFITVPEGTPSIIVHELLMAEPLLTGEIDVPAEGSLLPNTYDFERGEARAAVLARMQEAMTDTLAELWKGRGANAVVTTPQEAVTLASIVEKETGKASEREMVAGLYSNRIRTGMFLQADPTFIYPITKGKPLGRLIRRSDIAAINDYNTYSMPGLPVGPITNPGRESIAAVLNPAVTDALFMVADGTGGHEFNVTNADHEEAVARWRAIRRQRGEID
ncbi:endolytic transglycosylase MltG [Sphingomonadaceae bacterium]|nr:endolytic transglycosylase MltG [Sphingomonadaceae bacterium]